MSIPRKNILNNVSLKFRELKISNFNCIIIGALGKPYSRDLKYIWHVIVQLSKHPLRDYGSLNHIHWLDPI